MKIQKKQWNQYFNLGFIVITLLSIIFLFYFKNIRRFQPILYSILLSLCIIVCLGYFIYKNERKKKTKKELQMILSILLVGELLCCMISPFVFRPPTKDIYYGLDLSYWNKDLNFETIVEEYDFIILRLGYTGSSDGITNKTDSAYKEYVSQCEKYSIPYGVYFYSLATNTTLAKQEASYVIKVLDGKKPPLGVYIDLEDEVYQLPLDNQTLCDIANTFVSTVEKKGLLGGVYANYHWWTTKLTGDINASIKWLAYYSEEYELEETYQIHQYTNTGKVSGHNGNFDINLVKKKFW